jgi:PAS domain S-box-containing protein
MVSKNDSWTNFVNLPELQTIYSNIFSYFSKSKPQEILSYLLNNAISMFHAEFGYIMTKEQDELILEKAVGLKDLKKRYPLNNDYLEAKVFTQEKGTWISTFSSSSSASYIKFPPTASLVMIPIKGYQHNFGVLCIGSNTRVYTQKEVFGLGILAGPAGVAIEYTKLYQDILKVSSRLRLIIEIQKILISGHLSEVFILFANKLYSEISFDLGFIAAFHPLEQEFEFIAHVGDILPYMKVGSKIKASETFLYTHLKNLDPQIYNKIDDLKDLDLKFFSSKGFKSGVIVPLFSANTKLGIFGIWSRRPSYYQEEDLELLEGLRGPLSLALQNSIFIKRLIQGKKEWETTFDSMEDLVWIVDKDYRILRINTAFTKRLKCSPHAIVGKHCKDIIGCELPSCCFAKWKEDKREKSPIHYEMNNIGFPGSFEVTASPLDNEEGKITNIVFVARDTTEKKRLISQMIQADKIGTIGMLTAGVIHEINNPLAYVSSNLYQMSRYWDKIASLTKLILDNTSFPKIKRFIKEHNLLEMASQIEGILTESIEGTTRIQRIVHNLRTFSKGQSPSKERFCLNKVIEGSICLISGELKKYSAQLKCKFGKLPLFYGNQGQISQVFLNLLINAIQALNPENKERNQIKIKTSYINKEFIIEISDTGCGISPQDLKKIFEPFYTTKSLKEGTGLGLSIVQDIISEHGGDISVESTLGQGTTFKVKLPSCKPRISQYLTQPSLKKVVLKTKGKILIIDDEKNLLKAFSRLLSGLHEVSTAENAAKGLEMIKENDYDVILCDILMTDISGIDFYKKIQENFPDLSSKIIFITGDLLNEEIERFLSQIPNRVLKKPIDPKKLRIAIQESLYTKEEPSS